MIIRDKDKLKIIDLASQTLKTNCEIWAFGSRVNGDAHDMSDLDLVIVPKRNENLKSGELLNLQDNLRKSNIPIIVQVMDWDKIPVSFRKNILKNHEVMEKFN